MRGIVATLASTISQLLEVGEREVVWGDLAEAHVSPTTALREITSLVLRRQLELWADWRPWVATAVFAVPCTFFLMGHSVSLTEEYKLYAWLFENRAAIDSQLLDHVGLPMWPGVFRLLSHAVLLAMWAWTAGFAVASLSRRAIWAIGVICCIPCTFCLARFHMPALSPLSLFLFVLPGIWGAREGLRRKRLERAIAMIIMLLLITLSVPSKLMWETAGPAPTTLVLSLPALFVLASSWRREQTTT